MFAPRITATLSTQTLTIMLAGQEVAQQPQLKQPSQA